MTGFGEGLDGDGAANLAPVVLGADDEVSGAFAGVGLAGLASGLEGGVGVDVGSGVGDGEGEEQEGAEGKGA